MLVIFFCGKKKKDKKLWELFVWCRGYYVNILVVWDDDKKEKPGVYFIRYEEVLKFLPSVPTKDQIKKCVTKYS